MVGYLPKSVANAFAETAERVNGQSIRYKPENDLALLKMAQEKAVGMPQDIPVEVWSGTTKGKPAWAYLTRGTEAVWLHVQIGDYRPSPWKLGEINAITGLEANRDIDSYRRWALRIKMELDRPKCSQADIARFKEATSK